MRFVTLLLAIGMLVMLVGCQVDHVGPSWSAKILHKGENDNREHLSRSAGMTSGTGYGEGRMSWGLLRKGEK